MKPPGTRSPAGRLRSLWRRVRASSTQEQLEAELQFHLEMRAEDYRRRGLSPSTARREARRRLGDPVDLSRRVQAIHGISPRSMARSRAVQGLATDVGSAVRRLRRHPLFTLTGTAVLALGLGGSAVAFTAVERLLLHPLPFESDGRLYYAEFHDPARGVRISPDAEAVERWESVPGVSGLAMAHAVTGSLDVNGAPTPIRVGLIDPRSFATLALEPLVGRSFDAATAQPGAPAVAMVGEAYWRMHLAADPDVVGTVIRIDDEPRTVIGVMPRSAERLVAGSGVAAWRPMTLDDRFRSHTVLVALRQGVEPESIAPPLTAARDGTIWARLLAGAGGDGTRLELSAPADVVQPALRATLQLLAGATVLVLALSVANLTSLLLSHGLGRSQELAVRAALGAARSRLARMVMLESLLLALLGTLTGIALAALALTWLRVDAPPGLEDLRFLVLGGEVVGWCAGLGLLCGVAGGLCTRVSLHFFRRAGADGSDPGRIVGTGGRLQELLVAIEVALALALFVGATLLVSSLARLQAIEPGIRLDSVVAVRFQLSTGEFGPDERRVFFDQVRRRIAADPRVASAALAATLPLEMGGVGGVEIDVPDSTLPPYAAVGRIAANWITPGYFEALGTPLIEGRLPDEADIRAARPEPVMGQAGQSGQARPSGPVDQSEPVGQGGPPRSAPGRAWVNRSFARSYWPGESPVGRRFDYGSGGSAVASFEIVGVVGDVAATELRADRSQPRIYSLLVDGSPWSTFEIIGRASGSPKAALEALQEATRATDPRAVVLSARSLRDVLADQLARPRLITALLLAFAALATCIAGTGIYGVVAVLVRRRTGEIAVRKALGANDRHIAHWTYGHVVRPVIAGALVGMLVAGVMARWLQGLLYEISAADALSWGVSVVMLVVLGLGAGWLPARRAARLDPAEALRRGSGA